MRRREGAPQTVDKSTVQTADKGAVFERKQPLNA